MRPPAARTGRHRGSGSSTPLPAQEPGRAGRARPGGRQAGRGLAEEERRARVAEEGRVRSRGTRAQGPGRARQPPRGSVTPRGAVPSDGARTGRGSGRVGGARTRPRASRPQERMTGENQGWPCSPAAPAPLARGPGGREAYSRNLCPQLASAIAYRVLFSLVPARDLPRLDLRAPDRERGAPGRDRHLGRRQPAPLPGGERPPRRGGRGHRQAGLGGRAGGAPRGPLGRERHDGRDPRRAHEHLGRRAPAGVARQGIRPRARAPRRRPAAGRVRADSRRQARRGPGRTGSAVGLECLGLGRRRRHPGCGLARSRLRDRPAPLPLRPAGAAPLRRALGAGAPRRGRDPGDAGRVTASTSRASPTTTSSTGRLGP